MDDLDPCPGLCVARRRLDPALWGEPSAPERCQAAAPTASACLCHPQTLPKPPSQQEGQRGDPPPALTCRPRYRPGHGSSLTRPEEFQGCRPSLGHARSSPDTALRASPHGGLSPLPGLAPLTGVVRQNPLGCKVPVLVGASWIQGEFIVGGNSGSPHPEQPTSVHPISATTPSANAAQWVRPTLKKHLQRVPPAQHRANPPKTLRSPAWPLSGLKQRHPVRGGRRGKERFPPPPESQHSPGFTWAAQGCILKLPVLRGSRRSLSPRLVSQGKTRK